MIFSVVALLLAVASAQIVQNGLDLQDYSLLSRTDTSTSSSDESSDAKRIAKAVELALKEAELSTTLDTASVTSGDILLLRARLSTVNRAQTCTFACTADENAIGVMPIPEDDEDSFDGVKVTVTALGGVTKTAVFANGLAENQDDITGAFQLTANIIAPGEVEFTLSTENNQFGLNVTSVKIESADVAGGSPRAHVYFDPLSNAFWDFNTQIAVSDPNVRVAVAGPTIGCDATFEDFDFDGRTQFTVSAFGTADDDARTLTLNTTTQTFVFRSTVFRVRNELDVLNELPFTALPCAQRSAVTYDEIVVASTGTVDSNVGQLLDHPLIYDELKSEAQAITPAFDAFVRELQQAAGRRQIDLFDVILDRSAFTINSHTSKFTPCFRASFPEVEKFEIYIGMRSTSGPDGVVRAIFNFAGTDEVTQSTSSNSLEFESSKTFIDSVGDRAVVREVVFSALGLNETLFEETIQGTRGRPYLLLPSDVTVTLEKCPTFTYLN